MEVEQDTTPDLECEELQEELRAGTLSVLPGLRLCSLGENYVCGDGIYANDGLIFSSLVGVVKIVPIKEDKKRVEVISLGGGVALGSTGNVVTAIVARVTDRGVWCELRCSEMRPLTRPLRAQLMKENVHKTIAHNVSSMLRNLGVRSLMLLLKAADAPSGVDIVPLSWSKMLCPVTLVKKHRKLAKVAPENVYDIIEGKI